jgi:hypothetical protein
VNQNWSYQWVSHSVVWANLCVNMTFVNSATYCSFHLAMQVVCGVLLCYERITLSALESCRRADESERSLRCRPCTGETASQMESDTWKGNVICQRVQYICQAQATHTRIWSDGTGSFLFVRIYITRNYEHVHKVLGRSWIRFRHQFSVYVLTIHCNIKLPSAIISSLTLMV